MTEQNLSTDEIERYQSLAREAIACCPAYPTDRFAGRGVVICGGGRTYFTCAWVCIHMLRHLGCRLPIELWYLGPFEMSAPMQKLVEPLGVTCVDAHAVRAQHPVERLNGWELKPYSILHSCFEEVLFLDADNVPVVDPARFFDCEPYRQAGALFWPDFHPLDRRNPIWTATEVEYLYEPSFESGAIVVDKRRCWAELQLTMHYNEHSDFYYRHVGGDKDTFHLAWRRLERPYAMIPYHVQALGDYVMNQHDFNGHVAFHHRNNAKWTLELAANRCIGGFFEEERCLGYIADLASRWSGDPACLPPDSPAASRLHDEIAAIQQFVYDRVGYDKRVVRLLANQRILGAGSMEMAWFVRTRTDGQLELCIAGSRALTCALVRRAEGVFAGRWELFERMPVELFPLTSLPAREQLSLECEARERALDGVRALLVQVRRERRTVSLERDGRLRGANGGAAALRWSLRCEKGELALVIAGLEGGERLLFEDADGIYREQRSVGRDRVELIPLPRSESP